MAKRPTATVASTARQKELRLQRQNQELQTRLSRAPRVMFNANRFGPLLFILTFGVVGIYFALLSFAAPQPAARAVNLAIEPSAEQLARGQVLTVRVWADSLENPVDTVQARLMYSTETLEYLGTDASASAFGMEGPAETADTSGTIPLSRYSVQGLTGRQFVAKLTFRAKSATGTASLWFDQAKLLRSTDQANILTHTSGGQYTISLNDDQNESHSRGSGFSGASPT